MSQLIPDTDAAARMAGLEQFLEHFLGPRRAEYGASEKDLQSLQLPAPLQRFFRFAGRWPGHNPETPYENRFCAQDELCAIHPRQYSSPLRILDNRLVFVMECQGCWAAATETVGEDPPVWISEDCSHRGDRVVWRQLEMPLSHFLVSFVLEQLLFGAEAGGVDENARERFQEAGLTLTPLWINGEYANDYVRPSYYLIDEQILLRRALEEADGDDWYSCKDESGKQRLIALGLAVQYG